MIMENGKLILQKLEQLEAMVKSLEAKVAALDPSQAWRRNVGISANDPEMIEAHREDRERWARERARDIAKIDREIAREKLKKKKHRTKPAA
jgi:hypothetical protein